MLSDAERAILLHNRCKPAVDDRVAFVFFAVGFLDHAAEIGDAHMNNRRMHRFCQRDRIFNRIFDLQVIVIDHANAFDEMELITHRHEEARLKPKLDRGPHGNRVKGCVCLRSRRASRRLGKLAPVGVTFAF